MADEKVITGICTCRDDGNIKIGPLNCGCRGNFIPLNRREIEEKIGEKKEEKKERKTKEEEHNEIEDKDVEDYINKMAKEVRKSQE